MEYCEIKNPPEFSTQIEKLNKETWADGDMLGALMSQIFNNTVYNKTENERLRGKRLGKKTIPVSAWNNLSYIIENPIIKADSDIRVLFEFNSIPVVQKANIRGKAEVGKLTLVARKLPVADIVVEEIHVINRN